MHDPHSTQMGVLSPLRENGKRLKKPSPCEPEGLQRLDGATRRPRDRESRQPTHYRKVPLACERVSQTRGRDARLVGLVAR